MSTGQDQTQILYQAADRARAGVVDPRFNHDVEEAMEYFGADLASHVGRYDSGEYLVPLELWLGKWEPGAALVMQDRAVIVWGRTEVQSQTIPRKRPGGVADVDVQPDAVTLWIDCDQPRNVRVKRYEGTADVPTTFADMLRPDARDREATAVLPPEIVQCPHCFGEVTKGTDICPHCGRYIGDKPKRSKRWLIFLLLGLLLLLLIVGAILLLTGDEEQPARPTPTPTAEASAEPTADPFRRITGPGWEGRAPRAWRISGVDRQSGGRLLVRSLRDEDGMVIRIFHTPEEDANPGTFRVGDLQPLETSAAESDLAIVENFGVPECERRRCADLLLNDPAWGGIAITVNATQGERLDAAKELAASIKSRE
jgi:hypothetical protein